MNIKMTFAGAGRLALLFLVGLNILYIGTHAFPAVLQRRNPQPVDRIRTLTPQRQTPHRPATQSDVFVNIQTSPNIVPDISGMRLGVEPETTSTPTREEANANAVQQRLDPTKDRHLLLKMAAEAVGIEPPKVPQNPVAVTGHGIDVNHVQDSAGPILLQPVNRKWGPYAKAEKPPQAGYSGRIQGQGLDVDEVEAGLVGMEIKLVLKEDMMQYTVAPLNTVEGIGPKRLKDADPASRMVENDDDIYD